MKRYTKRRNQNGRDQVWDTHLNTWVLLSALSTEDQADCQSLPNSESVGASSDGYSSTSDFSSGGSSSDFGGGGFDGGSF